MWPDRKQFSQRSFLRTKVSLWSTDCFLNSRQWVNQWSLLHKWHLGVGFARSGPAGEFLLHRRHYCWVDLPEYQSFRPFVAYDSWDPFLCFLDRWWRFQILGYSRPWPLTPWISQCPRTLFLSACYWWCHQQHCAIFALVEREAFQSPSVSCLDSRPY